MSFARHAQKPVLYPTRWIENLLIEIATDPDATALAHDYMTVRWAVRIKPGISPHTLRRAFERLVARHETLRLRFVETRNGWQTEILPHHPTGLIIEDLGSMPQDEQQLVLENRVRRPLTALSDALFEMRLLRFGRSGDIILMRANHAIVDGYSVALLIEELLRHMMNVPVTSVPMSYGHFVRHQNQKSKDQATKNAAFWRHMLLPAPAEPNIGRAAKELGPMTASTVQPSVGQDIILGPADRARINALGHQASVSPFAVLHAAFSDTLCAVSGQDTVLVSSIFGRTDAALASYMGAAIEVAPLRYVKTGGGMAQASVDVAEKIAAIHQHLPAACLDVDGDLLSEFTATGSSYDRFWITLPHPSGRLKSSPFKSLFDAAMSGPVSLGPISMQQVIVPSLAPTDAEIDFSISDTHSGLGATLYADPASYTPEELAVLTDGIRERLALV